MSRDRRRPPGETDCARRCDARPLSAMRARRGVEADQAWRIGATRPPRAALPMRRRVGGNAITEPALRRAGVFVPLTVELDFRLIKRKL